MAALLLKTTRGAGHRFAAGASYCRLVSMTAANHAKASMILVVMLDPSMTVRPVKLTLSLTGSHTFFSFFFIMGGMPPPIMKENEKNV